MTKKIVIVTRKRPACAYCIMATQYLDRKKQPYVKVELDSPAGEKLRNSYNFRTLPGVIIDDKFVGGYHELITVEL